MTWANQIRILVQNIQQLAATLGGALINALKPVVKMLNLAMLQLNSFADTVVNALGKIFGWTYEADGTGGMAKNFSTAADSADDIASSTGKAAKNTKKIQEGIRAFDKLNVINLNKDTDGDKDNGTSGAGTGAGAGAKGGKWNKGEGILQKYESEISTLEQLGSSIATALSNALKGINWDSVYENARKFGSGLASFLNGLFTGEEGAELFSSLGTTIGGAINTAMYAIYEFAKEFKWKKFGKNLAKGINKFFKTWKPGLTAKAFNETVNGILDAMISAISNVKWERIAKKIAKLIGEIDMSGIGWRLGKLANSLANAFYALVSNKDTWSNLGQKIADGINGFFQGMGEVDTKTGLTGWEALGKDFTNTVTGIFNSISTALTETDWEEVGKSIVDVFANINWIDILTGAVKLIGSIAKGIFSLLKGALQEDIKYLKKYLPKWIKKIGDFFLDLKVKIGTKASEFASGVKKFIKNLPKNFVSISLKVASTVKDITKQIVEFIKSLPEKAYGFLLTILSTAHDVGESISKFIKSLPEKVVHFSLEIANTVNDISEKISKFIEKIPQKVVKFGLEVGEKSTEVGKKIADFIPTIPVKLYGFGMKIKDTVVDVSGKIVEFIKSLPEKAYDLVMRIKDAPSVFKEKIEDFVKKVKALGEIAVYISVALNDAFTKPLKGMWNGLAKSVNEGIKIINKIPGVKIASLPILQYAAGGFPPEDGWFRASKGEYFGQFDDGTSYIANNNQIEAGMAAGIEQAAYKGFMKALAEAGGNNTNVNIKIEGDRDKIFKVTREEARDYTRRTGRPAFNF